MKIELWFDKIEAEAVHHAIYLQLRYLASIEENNPDPARRRQAWRDAGPLIAAADRLKAAMEKTTSDDELRVWENNQGEPT